MEITSTWRQKVGAYNKESGTVPYFNENDCVVKSRLMATQGEIQVPTTNSADSNTKACYELCIKYSETV